MHASYNTHFFNPSHLHPATNALHCIVLHPQDQHTPCPDCCSDGDWRQPQGSDKWQWNDNEQWHGNTIAGFSAACWTFATA